MANTDILDVRSPYAGEVAGRVRLAGSADVEDALSSAERGFSITRRLPAHRRSAILYALVEMGGMPPDGPIASVSDGP